MFDKSILYNSKTVGTLIFYREFFVFMIGPDKTGEKLGIVRFGGHIEEGESIIQALDREIYEECSIRINIINSPKTFYIKSWNDSVLFDISNELDIEIKPLIIKGDTERSSVLYLSKTDDEPIPSSETNGIIFLRKQDIIDICTKKINCLSEFLELGGKLTQQKAIDYNKEMYAGVHLKLLYDLLVMGNNIIVDYINGKI